jgi:hypothetical protein
MKTNKQELVILVLLVIPISLTIVTTTIQSVKAMTGEPRDRDGGEMSK